MIDRKAFQISGAIFLVMVGVALWRPSLFTDWRHIPFGALSLLTAPASLLVMMVVPFISWLTAPRETRPSWQRWGGKWIVSWTLFWGLVQAFLLACSLGFVSLVPSPRLLLVYMGLIFMMTGNAFPKMPSRPQRNSFEANPEQQNQMLRLVGKLMFGLGLAFVVGGVLLPPQYWRPVLLSLTLTAFAAGIWHGVKLRHARSLQ